MAQTSTDISQRVHRFVLALAAMTWGGVLLIPVFPPGGLAVAMYCSWVTTGASAWAFFRTRNRKCLWALGLAFPVAAVFVIFVVWMLVSPVSCDESVQGWLHPVNR